MRQTQSISLNGNHFMNHVNSVRNRPQTRFLEARFNGGVEHEAGQKQIPEESGAPTPVEVCKSYRAENGFLMLDHVYVVSDRRL